MKVAAAILGFASMATAMCHYGTHLSPRSENGFTKRAEGVFGYHELTGPLNWHGLSDLNEDCALGTEQSPINVIASERTIVRGNTFQLTIPNKPQGARFENLGTTVQAFVGGTAKIGNKVYNLLQYHFHTPSEHHLEGEYFPAEVHFVFQAADNSLMVIGFFLEINNGDELSPVIQKTLENVSSIPNGGNFVQTGSLNFSTLIAHLNSSNVYRYPGSLTTPPCSQGVTFNVVAKPLHISVPRYRDLKDVVKFNSRYTQNKPGQVNLLNNARNVLDA